jgi:hypothetical protein
MVMDIRFPRDAFLAKSMTVVERNKSHQFKSRGGTPHFTSSCRSCENDWRKIMANALKLFLKKLPLMPKKQLL